MNPGYDTDHPPSRRKIATTACSAITLSGDSPPATKTPAPNRCSQARYPKGSIASAAMAPGANHVRSAQGKEIINPERLAAGHGWRCACSATSKPLASGSECDPKI